MSQTRQSEQSSVNPPNFIFMVGLPGSGKTLLARFLTTQGLARLCPDEEMFRRNGRRGYDFPSSEYLVRERPVLNDIAVELAAILAQGDSAVLDHGLWTPPERAHWRDLATASGAVPVLVYLPAPHDVLWSRIQVRNPHAHIDPNAIEFTEDDLRRYARRFHPPGDDEPHLIYSGRPEAVLAALGRGARWP